MASADNVEILVLGYANADVVARVLHTPDSGERVTASDITVLPGGMAANCACAAASRGSRVIFFGNIGRDPLGHLLASDFEAHGVDISHASRDKGTTVAIVIVPESGERAIISEPVPCDLAPLSDFLERSACEGQLLYVDGYHLVKASGLLRLAKTKGLITYCDLDGAPETYSTASVLEALASIDFVQWNPKVAAGLFPDQSRYTAMEHLSLIVPVILTTDGANPVTLREGNSEVLLPVPSVEAVADTTGAGDIFAGTFLSAYGGGKSATEASCMGILVATMSTRHHGARLPKTKAGKE